MADEKNCPRLHESSQEAHAFLHEECVTNSQGFIDDEKIREYFGVLEESET